MLIFALVVGLNSRPSKIADIQAKVAMDAQVDNDLIDLVIFVLHTFAKCPTL